MIALSVSASTTFSTFAIQALNPAGIYVNGRSFASNADFFKPPYFASPNGVVFFYPDVEEDALSPDEAIAIPVTKRMVFRFGKPHRQEFF